MYEDEIDEKVEIYSVGLGADCKTLGIRDRVPSELVIYQKKGPAWWKLATVEMPSILTEDQICSFCDRQIEHFNMEEHSENLGVAVSEYYNSVLEGYASFPK